MGAIGFFVYSQGYLNSILKKGVTPTPFSTPSANLNPVISPTPSAAKIYLLKLKLKSDSVFPPVGVGQQKDFVKLAEYLNNLLKLPEKSISQLIYDSRESSPYSSNGVLFNSSFYAILNMPTVLNPTAEDQYLSLNIEAVDAAMFPYLVKTDYCEKDADCSLSADICKYGAFNYYKKYVDPPWGCGPGGYKDKYSWFKWGEHDDQLNCEVELKFDGVKCANNECTETAFQKVCVQ